MPEYIIRPKFGYKDPIVKRYRGKPYRDGDGVMKVRAKTKKRAMEMYFRAKSVLSVSKSSSEMKTQDKNTTKEDLLIEGVKIGAEL